MVYHVTYAYNLQGISEHGLQPQGGGLTWQNKGSWAAGKNFFSDSLAGTHFWVDKLQDMTAHSFESAAWHEDNFVERLAIPVIIRFRFNQRPTTDRWGKDTASEQPQGDFFTKRRIDERGIDWWDGQKWQLIDDHDIDINRFVEKEPTDDYDDYVPEDQRFYWVFREPYPFPQK